MNIPLGDTDAVTWIDNGQSYDLDYLILNGVTVWEKIIPFTATTTWTQSTAAIQYTISGPRIGEFTKWSVTATRRSDGHTGGETFITDGSVTFGGILEPSYDGIWDFVYKGYIGSSLRGTQSNSLTIEVVDGVGLRTELEQDTNGDGVTNAFDYEWVRSEADEYIATE